MKFKKIEKKFSLESQIPSYNSSNLIRKPTKKAFSFSKRNLSRCITIEISKRTEHWQQQRHIETQKKMSPIKISLRKPQLVEEKKIPWSSTFTIMLIHHPHPNGFLLPIAVVIVIWARIQERNEGIKTTENAAFFCCVRDSHLHGAERYDNWRQWHMVSLFFFFLFFATFRISRSIEKDSSTLFAQDGSINGKSGFSLSRAVTADILWLFYVADGSTLDRGWTMARLKSSGGKKVYFRVNFWTIFVCHLNFHYAIKWNDNMPCPNLSNWDILSLNTSFIEYKEPRQFFGKSFSSFIARRIMKKHLTLNLLLIALRQRQKKDSFSLSFSE